MNSPRWRWFDVALALALGAIVGLRCALPFNPAEHPCAGPCDWAPGEPCGCDPVNGPCTMPCSGCCPGGCKPVDPPPTSPR